MKCSLYSGGVSLEELSVCGDDSPVLCAALSPSGNILCATTDDKSLAAWQLTMEGGVSGWNPAGIR